VPFGGYLKEAHVQVDPARLFALGLTLSDIEQAIAKSNINVGAGFLRHGDQELTVRGIGYLDSAQDIKRIVLKSKDGTPVTIGDIANVVQSYTPRRGAVGAAWRKKRSRASSGCGAARIRRACSTAYTSRSASSTKRSCRRDGDRDLLRPQRPRRADSVTVHKNLLTGFLLVVGVVWLFLRSLVCSAIVASVIPLSLLTAFLGLYALDLPANLISMGAIDFGILIDGAIVLVENVIHALRHEHPKTRRNVLQIVVRSAVDVGRPTFYAMLIIIAALVPVFTLQSVEGRIFRPLSLTYSFALVGALVAALTMVPALCAALLRPRHAELEEPAGPKAARALPALARVDPRAPAHRALAAASRLLAAALHDDAARHRVPARAGRRRHPALRRDAAEHRAAQRAGHPARGAHAGSSRFPRS
jgi:cobalt-zinc-cadmium resistance protein CzcA